MRYIAILKDSLREAWDSWVLLGLLVLSTLVILGVASLSFKPLTAQRTMHYFFNNTMFETLNKRKIEKQRFAFREMRQFNLQDVKQVSGDTDSPLGEYALTVAAHGNDFGPRRFQGNMGHPEPIEAKVDGGKPVFDQKAEIANLRAVFEDAVDLGFIKVESIEPLGNEAEKQEMRRYLITVKGTAQTHRIWATQLGLLFGAFQLEFISAPLGFMLYKLAEYVIGFGSWVAVLLGIVITSFFIPNMLRKGTIDMLLVKPISRWLLLFYKYLGGMAFILLSTTYAIGGIWLALGIRSGLWANGTLILILTITFFFAILYALSTLVSVVTRSVVASILITVGAWFIFFIIGWAHLGVEYHDRFQKEDDKIREAMKQPPRPPEEPWVYWVLGGIKVVHAISPRTEDLNQLNDLVVYTDFISGNLGDMGKYDTSKRNWWESLLVSGVWIGIYLGLAMLWFYYKDY